MALALLPPDRGAEAAAAAAAAAQGGRGDEHDAPPRLRVHIAKAVTVSTMSAHMCDYRIRRGPVSLSGVCVP